jgi:hypothetical protein
MNDRTASRNIPTSGHNPEAKNWKKKAKKLEVKCKDSMEAPKSA